METGYSPSCELHSWHLLCDVGFLYDRAHGAHAIDDRDIDTNYHVFRLTKSFLSFGVELLKLVLRNTLLQDEEQSFCYGMLFISCKLVMDDYLLPPRRGNECDCEIRLRHIMSTTGIKSWKSDTKRTERVLHHRQSCSPVGDVREMSVAEIYYFRESNPSGNPSFIMHGCRCCRAARNLEGDLCSLGTRAEKLIIGKAQW